jgi:hypothetical protein
MKESKKKNQRALLKMFEIPRENNETVGSGWEDEIELEDDSF